MAPPQLNHVTVSPVNPGGIESASNLYLGPNVAVKNTTEGFITNYLPISTASVLNAGAGINVNKDGDSSALTIRSSGNLDTIGSITAAGNMTTASTAYMNRLNVNNGKATISDTGLTTLMDDLVVGSTVYVTKASGKIHTTGDIETAAKLSVGSTVNSVGTVTIGGADAASYAIELMNTGDVTTKGNLYIGSNADSDKFEVLADTGNMHTKGTVQIDNDLTVGSEKFIVDAATGDSTQQGSLTVSSGGEDRFSVNGGTGDVYAKGNVVVGDNKFKVSASVGMVETQGDVFVRNGTTQMFHVSAADGSMVNRKTFTVQKTNGDDFFNVDANNGQVTVGYSPSTGKVHSSFTGYVVPDSYSDVLTTTDDVSKVTSTSDILTTQAYVDAAIWNQTKRLNLIVGANDTNLATFTNMFNMAQQLAGSDAVQQLNGLLDTTGEIKTSLTTVMNRAYNPVAVNCAPAVWQDECPPMPIPRSVSGSAGAYGLDGWYFRNLQLATMGASKINWYVPANGATMKVKHITNLFLNMFAVSNKSLPFISFLTAPKSDSSDLYSGVCNSMVNFYFSASNSSATANMPYTLYTGAAEPANCYNSNKLRCSTTSTKNGTNSTANGGVGIITNVTASTPFLSSFDSSLVSQEDVVLCFIIQTASTAAASDVNLVINSLCVESHDTTSDDSRDKVNGTTKFMFSNAAVSSNYHYNYFSQTHMDWTPIGGTKSQQYFDAYTLVARS